MKSKLKKLGRWSALPAIALLAALMLYNGILNPGFFKKATFATFLLSSTPLVCVVIGICTCKIVGGIDISLGNLLSLINVTMAVLFTNTELPAAVILLIGLGIGLAGGLLNGICIGILRVNPLLATFATSSVFWGLALWILPTPGGYGVPYAMAKFVNKMVFGVVPMSLLLVALLTIIWLLYMKSVHGVAKAVYSVTQDDCIRMATETGITSLAIGIGNRHGFYDKKPNLNIALLADVHRELPIPLVLHGSSGLEDAVVKECIRNGISKVNVGTALHYAYKQKVAEVIDVEKKNYAVTSFAVPAKEAIKDVVRTWIRVCGAEGKAL